MKWYAHSAEHLPEEQWQPLRSHLENVGRLAADKASHFNGQGLAQIAGLLHDLGKYTPQFQQRLRGSQVKVDHSTHGALHVLEIESLHPFMRWLLAHAIAGHHAGLADRQVLSACQKVSALNTRLGGGKQALPKLSGKWRDELEGSLANICRENERSMPLKTAEKSAEAIAWQLSVLGRMLYSCLVDADYLDTEAFYRLIENRPTRDSNYPSIEELKKRLDGYLSKPVFQSDVGINKIRKHILNTVRERAVLSPGLFTLNVPTGGGKTLTSLAFALDHAKKHQLRRVILVIPFTSIVEQNADVWRKALSIGAEDPTLLEHHSGFNFDAICHQHPSSKDKLREAAENWQSPIIVTTAVQFFESLFANRSSRCRKLHNIAESVVILDEAQTLPTQLLRPCVAMIKELALNYRTSMVMCTATQPALRLEDGFTNGLEQIQELAPTPELLHKQLERVRVEHIGALDDDSLAEELLQHHQVLCIVNNRRHARALFEKIRIQTGAAHLTTLMCAQHRSEKLAELRKMLIAGEPVRLVSTSLIEAGVDVDFPCVYRAEAGLDSIAQAAGRCNREGERAIESSLVRVFQTEKQWSVPPELKQYADAFRRVYRKHRGAILSLAAMQEYFQEVYWQKTAGIQDGLDAKAILACTQLDARDPNGLDISFEQIANKFQMIESNMLPVIVPYDETAIELLDQLEYADRVGALASKLQRYLVQVPQQGLMALEKLGAVQAIRPEKFGNQFLRLEIGGGYDQECGLECQDLAFIDVQSTIIS
ncbi:CRISPR-associated helicase/endonuclease Cas3 [Bacterioplanes sanyensis]|uniref:CRISPR-associated helicase Cas3' n=1 Tax=Bacterioplanes sanyensis TaxID=1249553 RepID=UPI00167C0DFC|nr:CRISPR-associated helicase Cas3' [Bacterioplanes sanyensis]GGY43328.1 CRISPR-associated helicase/endonuclease Cas3 [Bacterioplanes sanyensis]